MGVSSKASLQGDPDFPQETPAAVRRTRQLQRQSTVGLPSVEAQTLTMGLSFAEMDGLFHGTSHVDGW